MNRRTFLGNALGTAAGVTATTLLTRNLGWAHAANLLDAHKIDHLGVQLYTVRDQLKADFEGTLAKVAAIGYKEVEFAGYFDHSPKEVRASLDHHGLTSPSCHMPYEVLTPDKWPAQIESAKTIGQSYIICPWIPEEIRNQPDGWKHAFETFNRAGEASHKAGIQFGYHNHWFEFLPVNGKLPYDELLAACDPKFVKMELDLCWITVAGGDPIKYFNKYPGRFPLVHVKDMKQMPKVTASGGQDFGDSLKEDMTAVGSGVIDWKSIFSQAGKGGIKYYIVEHDKAADPFDSITKSHDYLEKLRF